MNRLTLAPSWSAVLPLLLDALEQGNETARAAARAELMRLAEIADCAIERDRNPDHLNGN